MIRTNSHGRNDAITQLTLMRFEWWMWWLQEDTDYIDAGLRWQYFATENSWLGAIFFLTCQAHALLSWHILPPLARHKGSTDSQTIPLILRGRLAEATHLSFYKHLRRWAPFIYLTDEEMIHAAILRWLAWRYGDGQRLRQDKTPRTPRHIAFTGRDLCIWVYRIYDLPIRITPITHTR